MDDPQTIEALFCKFDSVGLLSNWTDDGKRHVGSSGSNSSPNSLVPVIEVLGFIALEGKQLLKEIRAMVVVRINMYQLEILKYAYQTGVLYQSVH